MNDFIAFGSEAFAEVEHRTVRGLVMPLHAVADTNGNTWRFGKNSISFGKETPLHLLHPRDGGERVGTMRSSEWTKRGLEASFSVDEGPLGDQVLVDADAGFLSFSISVEQPQGRLISGAQLISSAVGTEVSLTPNPVFSGAVLDSVSFSRDNNHERNGHMTEEATEVTAPQPVTVQFDHEAFAKALAAAMPPAPTVVPGAPLEVNEEKPYRFDGESFGQGGKFDFAADLKGYQRGDHEAEKRVLAFLDEQFAVTAGNVSHLNPIKQRQDLYVDRKEYQYPLWNRVKKETLPDATALTLPKYNSSSGLIASMSEGVEPAAGAFTTTDQTVTPTEVGGKVELTRRLWDQIGPRVSTEIYNKMLAGWYEMLEANVVAALDAVTPIGITLTALAQNKALSADIAGAWSDLQFIRGGFRFDTFAVQIDLFKALAKAVTDTGEPLFPMISPNNRNGDASPRFSRMNVHGVDAFPEWALAASGSVAASSYLFDSESVYAAASTPQRLDWNFGTTVQSTTNLPQVSMVTIGIHGYCAAAILDLTGIREVIYDPS